MAVLNAACHTRRMTYIITSPCIGVQDGACREVCPVDCIHDAGDQFVIDPDECIRCGACVSVCPVNAIFPEEDVPANEHAFIARNYGFFGV